MKKKEKQDARPEKPKKEKKIKEKKPQVVENHGITGIGTDYTVYILSNSQKLLALAAGLMIGFVASYIYFDNTIVSVLVGLAVAYKAPAIYANSLFRKRQRDLRIQFRDMLESLSNSYTVGMTANRAFHAAYSDMAVEHGPDAWITKELQLICSAHDNQGIEIKDMMNDFAQRSGIDDVRSFAGVFDVSSDLGGDIAKVVRETRDMIGDKIEVELEIQTIVTAQKNQLNILAVMPLVMSLLTRSFESGGGGGMIVVLIKLAALGLFVFAYWMGTKIVDIKV